jgi:hypothetical protein
MAASSQVIVRIEGRRAAELAALAERHEVTVDYLIDAMVMRSLRD